MQLLPPRDGHIQQDRDKDSGSASDHELIKAEHKTLQDVHAHAQVCLCFFMRYELFSPKEVRYVEYDIETFMRGLL